MSKYPFTPEILDALPEELAKLFRSLEDTLLTEICSRLKAADQFNEVTVQDIRALRSHGIDLKEIRKAIQKTTGISEKKLNELLDDVVERNQRYYTELIDLAHITQPETLVDAATVAAIRSQTLDTFRNLTASMGFLVDAGRTMLPPAKAYQWALDNAEMQVQSGAINYNQAIKSAVRQLAESGVKAVDYESGHRDRIDVAVRRAVMTGVNQLCDKYTEQSAEYLDTPYFEVSAHAGARDKPGPSPWSSHKEWQGKVYSVRSGDIYPSIYEVCGLGAVDGLMGANCRHRRYSFVEGVSERTYTDEQLAHIDDGLGCTFDGKTYTAYEATQMQRRVERQIRAQKRLKNAYKAAGLTEDATAANVKLRRLNAKYRAFSKAAGLPGQRERTKVLYQDDTKSLVNVEKSAIIEEKADKGGAGVQTIGKIDITKYMGVANGEIRSETLVLTDNQKEHIIKRRGQEFFDKYGEYFQEIAKDPDYIFRDRAIENTAIASKTILDGEANVNLVIRLALVSDEAGLENSIITAIAEGDKRYRQRLRNNLPLYKKE